MKENRKIQSSKESHLPKCGTLIIIPYFLLLCYSYYINIYYLSRLGPAGVGKGHEPSLAVLLTTSFVSSPGFSLFKYLQLVLFMRSSKGTNKSWGKGQFRPHSLHKLMPSVYKHPSFSKP